MGGEERVFGQTVFIETIEEMPLFCIKSEILEKMKYGHFPN